MVLIGFSLISNQVGLPKQQLPQGLRLLWLRKPNKTFYLSSWRRSLKYLQYFFVATVMKYVLKHQGKRKEPKCRTCSLAGRCNSLIRKWAGLQKVRWWEPSWDKQQSQRQAGVKTGWDSPNQAKVWKEQTLAQRAQNTQWFGRVSNSFYNTKVVSGVLQEKQRVKPLMIFS